MLYHPRVGLVAWIGLSFIISRLDSRDPAKNTNIISIFMDPVVKPRGDIKDYWIPAFAGMT
ncbi:palindromic element RPE4 domain-containing protein [Rickettsia amblyommatis]